MTRKELSSAVFIAAAKIIHSIKATAIAPT
jgi:hypothetical protein